jgi:hypothetical protein
LEWWTRIRTGVMEYWSNGVLEYWGAEWFQVSGIKMQAENIEFGI